VKTAESGLGGAPADFEIGRGEAAIEVVHAVLDPLTLTPANAASPRTHALKLLPGMNTFHAHTSACSVSVLSERPAATLRFQKPVHFQW